MEVSTPTSLSPAKWGNGDTKTTNVAGQDDHPAQTENRSSGPRNPWTIQKNRTELSHSQNAPPQDNWKPSENRFYKTKSVGNLTSRKLTNPKFSSSENLLEERRNKNDSSNDRKLVGMRDEEGTFNPEEVTWALVPVSALVSITL